MRNEYVLVRIFSAEQSFMLVSLSLGCARTAAEICLFFYTLFLFWIFISTEISFSYSAGFYLAAQKIMGTAVPGVT